MTVSARPPVREHQFRRGSTAIIELHGELDLAVETELAGQLRRLLVCGRRAAHRVLTIWNLEQTFEFFASPGEALDFGLATERPWRPGVTAQGSTGRPDAPAGLTTTSASQGR